MGVSDQLFINRFSELDEFVKKLPKSNSENGGWYISERESGQYKWAVSVEHLLANLFSENSIYFKNWIEAKKRYTNFYVTSMHYEIFRAAKEDFEKGYAIDHQSLIEANILGSAIEQAEALYAKEYYQAAAIVAGVALETHLKSLCEQFSITFDPDKGTIQNYNNLLYKAEKYTQPQMQEITTWGNIRNAAAHGKWGEFTKEQVDLMIKGITRFLTIRV